ncbi:hypothetical protein V8C86DRAFT_2668877 [Haematococcus lacustris]
MGSAFSWATMSLLLYQAISAMLRSCSGPKCRMQRNNISLLASASGWPAACITLTAVLSPSSSPGRVACSRARCSSYPPSWSRQCCFNLRARRRRCSRQALQRW